jgi:hypothetical protein
MVIQPKNHDTKKIRICVDFRGLNKLRVIDPFPTPFSNQIINEVKGQEFYFFKQDFSSYNQVPISKEDEWKTTFFFEFKSIEYRLIPFGLKNAPTIFSQIVVKEFEEYIYKKMVVYYDDYTIYNMLKDHIEWLRMMLERCRQIHLFLNIKKIIFATPIGILLGHIVCKDGIKVDMAKIKVILELKPPINQNKIKIFIGNTRYYRTFIQHYSDITFLIDELLKK